MKKIIIFLAFLLCVQISFAQKNKRLVIPESVKGRFLFLFPQTQDTVANPIKWEKVKGNYRATITVMDAPATAVIDSSGKALRVERVVHEFYLPEKAKEYLKTNYKELKVKSVVQVTDDKGKIVYTTLLESKPVFDQNGNLLKIDK
ncbi:MAG: hypothetical protein WCK34_03740 [Bacteroidota bacterium]